MSPPDECHRQRDGTRTLLRPVRGSGAQAIGRLVRALSAADRQRRFHAGVAALPMPILQRMVDPPSPQQLARVAIAEPEGRAELVADVRCLADASGCGAEFVRMVATPWRRLGIAERALDALRRAAARAGLLTVELSTTLPGSAAHARANRMRGGRETPVPVLR